MRSPTFQRLMTHLALAAALLLAFAPVVGRVLGNSSAHSNGLWAQMCTSHGLELVRLPLGRVDPGPVQAQGGEDCPYCPLLNTLTALLVCAALVLAQAAGSFATPTRAAKPRLRTRPSGLGARGPPLIA